MASALTLCTCQTDRQTDTDKTGDILQRLCTRLIRDRQTTDRQVTYHRGDGLGSDIVHVADCQVDVHLPVTHQTTDDLPQGAHQPASGRSVTGGGGGDSTETTDERMVAKSISRSFARLLYSKQCRAKKERDVILIDLDSQLKRP